MELKRGNFFALTPLLVFIIVYLSTSIILNDFYKMPVLVAFLFATLIGFIQYPKIAFHDKVER